MARRKAIYKSEQPAEGALSAKEGNNAPCSPKEWGALLAALFSHKLVIILSAVNVEGLSGAEATEVLYEEMESFVTLKIRLECASPQHPILQPAHLKLLDFVQRLLVTLHQTLRNSIQAEKERTGRTNEVLGILQAQTEPRRRMLLGWQMRRMNEARLQLLLALAEVEDNDQALFEDLDLHEDIRREMWDAHEGKREGVKAELT